MEQLGQRHRQAILGFLRNLYSLRNLSAFTSYLLSALPKVIPADICGYSKVDSALRRIAFWTEPPERKLPGSERAFERHMDEHPFIAYRGRTLDTTALRLSDFLSREQLHGLGLYTEFYRPLGVEFLMSIPLRLRPPVEVAVALARNRRDFSRQDRDVLNLLRPHLVEALENAEIIGGVERDLDALRRDPAAADRALAVLTPAGRIRLASARARELLVQHFEGGSASAEHLPELLLRWVRHQEDLLLAGGEDIPPPRRPLVVGRDGGRLVLRLFSDAAESVLLLEEEPEPVRPAAREPLGLTPREADVLTWVAEGKTNADIGTILGLSPRTVQKHLEHIYQKLGVETRTAAAVRAFQAAAPARRDG